MNGTNTPTSVVLNTAADLIEKFGWERGGTRNSISAEVAAKHPGYCLEGAISAAIGEPIYDGLSLRRCPAYSAVTSYLGGLAPWIFNDRQRDPETAIATLRAAALIEAAKENTETREQVAR